MKSTARTLSAIRRPILGAIAIALAVGAASTPFATAAVDATPTPPAVQQNSGPFSPDIPVDNSRVWIVLLIFLTALGISAIFSYVLRKENQDTRAWARDLLGRGYAVSTDQVAAVLTPEPRSGADSEVEGSAPAPAKVLGPTTIAKGVEIYYRVVDEAGKLIEGETVTWDIVAGSIATPEVTHQDSGAFTMLSTNKLGNFILKVKAGERPEGYIPITVVETLSEPKQSGLRAFFLGDGYGTINLALFLMAVVAALGAIGVVGDGTVSTIFGAMAGYIFGIAVVTHGKGGESGSGGES